MPSNEPFSIHALELGPMENFIYLIHDHASGRAAVVDPAWDVPEVLALAEARGMRITDILLTHSHHDHINGISDVLEKYDAQLHLMKSEAQFWGSQLDLPSLHHGGDVIELGDSAIKALHTPGHTPGSQCFLVEEAGQVGRLISGDTLFLGGCGRVDLPGSDPEAMYRSLNETLKRLADETLVFPGHLYSREPHDTLGNEKRTNPFLRVSSLDQFLAFMRA